MAAVAPEGGRPNFCRVGLIVTGETESLCLPDLFRELTSRGLCSFSVIRRVGQRSAIESPRRKLRMAGSGKVIPNRDAEQIGVPTRRFLRRNGHYVLLVDAHVLGRADTCASLRTMFVWASEAVGAPEWLPEGRLLATTKEQVEALRRAPPAGKR